MVIDEEPKNNIVPLHPTQKPATTEGVVPPEAFLPGAGGGPASRLIQLPEPQAAQGPAPDYLIYLTVRDGMINGFSLVQGLMVIEYIRQRHSAQRDRISAEAERNNVNAEAACAVLEGLLQVGRLHAEGPAGPIAAEWWRYARIFPDGRVDYRNIPRMIELPWFFLLAQEVLTELPPPEWMLVPPDVTAEIQAAPPDRLTQIVEAMRRLCQAARAQGKRPPKLREEICLDLRRDLNASRAEVYEAAAILRREDPTLLRSRGNPIKPK